MQEKNKVNKNNASGPLNIHKIRKKIVAIVKYEISLSNLAVYFNIKRSSMSSFLRNLQ